MRPVQRDNTPDAPAAGEDGRRLLDRIGRQVLQALGQPPGLRAVHVRPLWGNHYRANVVVGPDATATAVAHSYFLSADAEGTILTTAPVITRRYPAAAPDRRAGDLT
jgi:hypothetical protein